MFEVFKEYANLIVVLSEKSDGAMKFSPENKERFLGKLGIKDKLAVKAGLVYGNNVKVVSNEEAGKTIEKTDGLITADKNLFLTITMADCLPIFIFDPEKEIIGLVHGGWRNLAQNILTLSVEKIAENFGSLPKDILVGIGPGISQCHFEVKEDLLVEFKPYLGNALLNKNGKLFLDLKKIAKIQLINLGIKEENIEISPECTFCLSDKYFSYRRDRFKEIKTMMAVIGRK
ncbi:peptidoglycan editing factor PgeF [Patescibacteria group bacterium]|nr:peptidoglycan editing factor PgeF [Patescibacteria group bacterium]